MKGNGHSVQELVRLEAYLLSERAGHPQGRQQAFWAQAEEIVLGRGNGSKSTKKPATAKAKAAAAPAKKPAKKAATAPAKVEKQLPLMPSISTGAAKKAAPKVKASAKPAKTLAKSVPKAK